MTELFVFPVGSFTGIRIWSSFRLLAFNCCSSNTALCSNQQWWVKKKKKKESTTTTKISGKKWILLERQSPIKLKCIALQFLLLILHSFGKSAILISSIVVCQPVAKDCLKLICDTQKDGITDVLHWFWIDWLIGPKGSVFVWESDLKQFP